MTSDRTSILKKVSAAQGEIIDRLARCETLLAELYTVYCEIIPEMKDFWGQLIKEEKGHAKILMTLHSMLDRGRIFYNLDRFNQQVITDYIDRIMKEVDSARRAPITATYAIETAISLEVALIDTRFYDTVTSDAPEFALIAKQLSSASRKHIESIQNQHTLLVQAHVATRGSRTPPGRRIKSTDNII